MMRGAEAFEVGCIIEELKIALMFLFMVYLGGDGDMPLGLAVYTQGVHAEYLPS